MGQTQGTPLAISFAEQDVEKYLKQRLSRNSGGEY